MEKTYKDLEGCNLRGIYSPTSLNNRLVLEAYKKEGLKSSVQNGFAMIQQKVAVKGLTVLMDAKLGDGSIVPKGSLAFVREELLHTQAWANKTLECPTIPGAFIIVDLVNVEFITPPTDNAA